MVGLTLYSIGSVNEYLQEYEEALSYYKQALTIYEVHYDSNSAMITSLISIIKNIEAR